MKYILITLILLGGALLSAQVSLERFVIGSLGQSVSGAELRLSATVGEAVVTTVSAGDLVLTQGFQQREPEDLTAVYLLDAALTDLSVYPNPTAGPLVVRLRSSRSEDYRLGLYNALGQQLAGRALRLSAATPAAVEWDLGNYPPGMYYLRLTTKGGQAAATVRVVRAHR